MCMKEFINRLKARLACLSILSREVDGFRLGFRSRNRSSLVTTTWTSGIPDVLLADKISGEGTGTPFATVCLFDLDWEAETTGFEESEDLVRGTIGSTSSS